MATTAVWIGSAGRDLGESRGRGEQMASVVLHVPRALLSPRPCKDYRCASSKRQRLERGTGERPPCSRRGRMSPQGRLSIPSAFKGSRAEPSAAPIVGWEGVASKAGAPCVLPAVSARRLVRPAQCPWLGIYLHGASGWQVSCSGDLMLLRAAEIWL